MRVAIRTILGANRQTIQFALGQFVAGVARAFIRSRAKAVRAIGVAQGLALVLRNRRISDVAFAQVWTRALSVHAFGAAYGLTNVISILVTVATSLL